MFDDKVILCGSSSYEKIFYFNPEFDSLPKQIKEELNALRRMVGKTTPDKIDVTSAGNIHEAADRLKATLQRYNENI